MRHETRVLEVTTLRGLSAIQRSSLDVVAWVRQLAMADWLSQLVDTKPLRVDETVDAAGIDWGRWLNTTAGCRQKALFVDDLDRLAQAFARITKCQRLRVQLAVIESQKCPKFHVDSVGIRLLCTYVGSGTELVDERNVDRNLISRCGPDRAPTHQPPRSSIDGLVSKCSDKCCSLGPQLRPTDTDTGDDATAGR